MSGYISGIASHCNAQFHNAPLSSPRMLSRGEEDSPESILTCRSNCSPHNCYAPSDILDIDHWKHQQCHSQNPRSRSDLPHFQNHHSYSQAQQSRSEYPSYSRTQFDYHPHSHYGHTLPSSTSPLTSSGVFSSRPPTRRPSSSALTSSYPSSLPFPPSSQTSRNFTSSYRQEPSYREEYNNSRRYNNYTYSGHRESPSHRNPSPHDWQSESWSAPTTRYRTTYSGLPSSHPLNYSSNLSVQTYSKSELPSPGSENLSDSSPPSSVMVSPRHISYSEVRPSCSYPSSPTSFIDIFCHPQDLIIEQGDTIMLNCEARILSSSERPTYQWYKDEEPIIGEVQSWFRLRHAGKEDLGYYFCVVSSTTGSMQRKSSVACVKMAHQALKPDTTCKPVILDQPEPTVLATLGERLVLKLSVTAQPDASFQWFKNGIEMPSAFNNELVFPCVTLRDEGQYICSIKNDLGTILSETFTVHLARRKDSLELSGSYGNPNNDPKISLPPSYLPSNTTLPAWAPPTSPTKPKSAKWHNKISDEVIELITSQICRQIGPSENLEGVRLSLGISQSETNAIRAMHSSLPNQVKELIHLWCKNVSHCSAALLEESLQVYGLRVSVPSLSSSLRPETGFKSEPSTPPTILRHPESIQIHPGETVDMVVEAEGSNITYQWYKDGHPYPGQTRPRILITDAQEPSRGLYYCCVKNSYGSVKSHPARVDIIPLKAKLPPSLQSSHYFPPSHEPTPAALFSPPPDIIPRRGSGDTSSLDSLSQQISSFTSSVSERLENWKWEENDHKPVILEQPVSQTLAVGDVLQLKVVCKGAEKLKYSWYFNGLAMRSEKQSEFTLYCFTEDDVGDYSCEISNEYGSTMSEKAVITLKPDEEDEEHS